ncbi:hypothetical protein J4464_03595 [Candidatus Woesearchaeota archaeon]|nr:hypothetical protein [Candidatus Woesearchaeota archaeon]
MKVIQVFIVFLVLVVGCAQQEQINWDPKPNIPITDITVEPTEPQEEIPADVPRKEFKEGDLVRFPNLAKQDADRDPITYTFTEPLTAEGEWQTEIGDAGEYKVTITAKDSKGAETTQDVVLVIRSVNRPPIIELQAVSGSEGETINLNPNISDPEGDEVTITYSGWMDSASKEATYDDSGRHTVTVEATDAKGASSKKTVSVTIDNVNRAPIIKALDDLTVKEGEVVSIKAEAADPDGDKVQISFSTPLNAQGAWTPKVGDAGDYDITISAGDGSETAEEAFTLTVLALNNPPELTLAEESITVEETEDVVIEATAEDPDGDEVSITYSGWMTAASKTTTYDDAGTYDVTVTATDSKGAKTTKTVTVVVEDKNRPPVINI